MRNALPSQSMRLRRTGSGPVILLLHCLGVDGSMWGIAAADLARNHTVVTCDFPGHGGSPIPRHRYDIEDLSAEVARLIEEAELGPCHVGGISLCGLVAQHIAATRADLVERLVLIDTTPRYTEAMRAMWADRAATARSKGVAAMVPDLLKVWFTPDYLARDDAGVRYARVTLERASGEGYALACEALAAADLCASAEKIKARTLVLCGEADLPSFIEAAHWLATHIPGAQLEWIRPAQHASVLEQPEAFCRAVEAFLQQPA